MKTNMMTKCILGVLAVLTVCLFFMPAFAADETQAAETVPAENSCPGKEHKPGKHERPKKGGDSFDDRFEDWFEDRIEALENTVDFSELPDEPTEADMVEFFRKFFMGDTETSAEAVKATSVRIIIIDASKDKTLVKLLFMDLLLPACRHGTVSAFLCPCP